MTDVKFKEYFAEIEIGFVKGEFMWIFIRFKKSVPLVCKGRSPVFLNFLKKWVES